MRYTLQHGIVLVFVTWMCLFVPSFASTNTPNATINESNPTIEVSKGQQIGQLKRYSVVRNIPLPADDDLSFDTLDDDSMQTFGTFGLSSQSLSTHSVENINKNGASRLLSSYQSFVSYASPNSATASDVSLALVKKQSEEEDEDVEPRLLSGPYNFPNPFVLKEGTQIGYRLSKNMDITLTIYNMMGTLIFSEFYPASSVGAQKGYNKLAINNDTFQGVQLSSGVYFYYLSFNGNIIGQNKLAIIPAGEEN